MAVLPFSKIPSGLLPEHALCLARAGPDGMLRNFNELGGEKRGAARQILPGLRQNVSWRMLGYM